MSKEKDDYIEKLTVYMCHSMIKENVRFIKECIEKSPQKFDDDTYAGLDPAILAAITGSALGSIVLLYNIDELNKSYPFYKCKKADMILRGINILKKDIENYCGTYQFDRREFNSDS